MLNLCLEKILGNFTRQNLVDDINSIKKELQFCFVYFVFILLPDNDTLQGMSSFATIK